MSTLSQRALLLGSLLKVNNTPKLTLFWLALFFATAEGLSPPTGPATEPAAVLVKFFPSPPAELACPVADVIFIDVRREN